MGILDNLKNQVEKLGEKAREGLDDVKDKAGDLLDDAKERFGNDDERPPLSESSDVGPDSSSTDAVQPGYVAAEDDASEDSEESAFEAEAELDTDDDPGASGVDADPVDEDEVPVTEPAASSDVVPPAAAELDPVDLDAEETHADEQADPEPAASDPQDAPTPAEPLVERDVDPYEEPLTQTIGDELADALVDREAVADAVDPDRDTRA